MRKVVTQRPTQRLWKRLPVWFAILCAFAMTGIVGCGQSKELDTTQQALTSKETFSNNLQQIQAEGALLRGRLANAESALALAYKTLDVPRKVADGLGKFKRTLDAAVDLSYVLRSVPAIRTPITKLQKTLKTFRDKVKTAHNKTKHIDKTYLSPVRFRLKQLEEMMQKAQVQIEKVEEIARYNEQAISSLSYHPECDALLNAYIAASQPVATATLSALQSTNNTITDLNQKLHLHLSFANANAWANLIDTSQTFLGLAGNFDISLGAGLSLSGLLGKLRGITSILKKKIDFGFFSMSIQDALDAASWIIDMAKSLLDPILKPIENLIQIPSLTFPGLGDLTSFLNNASFSNPLAQLTNDFKSIQLPDFGLTFTLNADITSVFLDQLCRAPSLSLFTSIPDSLQKRFYIDTDQLLACPTGAKCMAGQAVPCPSGSYCSEGGVSSCAELTPKHYCDGSVRKPCPAGSQCIQGKKLACPDTYTYKTGISTITTRWIYCEGGTPHDCFSLNDGENYCEFVSDVSTKAYKKLCPKGKFCRDGRAYPCEEGYGCAWSAKLKCDELGPFLFCNGMNLTPCPKGAYCDKGKIMGYCKDLPTDAHCTGRAPNSTEIPLAAAREQIGTVSVKQDCPAHTSYCKQGVRSDCPAASSGEYCDDGKRLSCDTLTAGYLCKVVDGTNHKLACKGSNLSQPFSYCEAGEAQSCSSLDPFLYCAGDATEGYTRFPCPKGWRCSAGVKLACPSGSKCEQGVATPCPTTEPCNFISKDPTFYEEAGQAKACAALLATHHCTTDGCNTDDCGSSLADVNRLKAACPVGSYCAFGIVQGQCSTLDHRYHCDGTLLAPCPAGSYCEAGKSYPCAQLPKQYYCAGSEKKSCPHSKSLCRDGVKSPCPAGSYCLSSNQYSCANLKGWAVCMDGTYGGCPSGHSCIKGIAYKCSELPATEYCKSHAHGSAGYSQHGYRQRTACPEGSYCAAGVAHSCQALAKEFYCKDHKKLACPDGFLCEQGKRKACPQYHTCQNNQSAPCTEGLSCVGGFAYPCPENHYCADGQAHPNGISLNGSLSGIYVNLEKHLYHVNTQTGSWRRVGTANWSNAKGMARIGNSLYAVQSNALYKINPSNGSYSRLGNATWSMTYGMTAIGNRLYIAQGGSLYKVDPTNGAYTRLGSAGSWWHVGGVASALEQLYIIQDGSSDSLFHVNKDTGAWTRKGPSGAWNNTHTQVITSINDALYVVQNGNLYKIDPTDGSWSSLTSNCGGTWAGARVMTSQAGQLYIMTAAEWSTSTHRVREFRMYRVNTTAQCSWTRIGSTRSYHASAPPSLADQAFRATSIH